MASGTNVYTAVIQQGLSDLGQVSTISGLRGAAKTAKLNAREFDRIGPIEAEERRRAGYALIGAQRTTFAASGRRFDSGTPLELMAQTAEDEELAAAKVHYEFKLAASQQRQLRKALKRQITGNLIKGISGAIGGAGAMGGGFGGGG